MGEKREKKGKRQKECQWVLFLCPFIQHFLSVCHLQFSGEFITQEEDHLNMNGVRSVSLKNFLRKPLRIELLITKCSPFEDCLPSNYHAEWAEEHLPSENSNCGPRRGEPRRTRSHDLMSRSLVNRVLVGADFDLLHFDFPFSAAQEIPELLLCLPSASVTSPSPLQSLSTT